MPEYRKGIENVPLLSPNTDCPIMVFVIDLLIKTPDTQKEYRENF